MKQSMSLLIIIVAIIAIVVYLTRFNNPVGADGYRKLEQKTTTKYVKDSPRDDQIETSTTRVEKASRDGDKITIKEHTKSSVK